jgi:hypothetical protein
VKQFQLVYYHVNPILDERIVIGAYVVDVDGTTTFIRRESPCTCMREANKATIRLIWEDVEESPKLEHRPTGAGPGLLLGPVRSLPAVCDAVPWVQKFLYPEVYMPCD